MTETTEEYRNLRDRILGGAPEKGHFTPTAEWPTIWGVVMEIGHATTPVTLVVLTDRTVSVFFGSGGGIVGGGPHESVWSAARTLLSSAENARGAMKPAGDFPLPLTGMIRFYALCHDGRFSGSTSLEHLETGSDPFMHLFVAGNSVLTELRVVNESSGSKGT